MSTETTQDQTAGLAHPSELTNAMPMPTEEHVFKLPDGSTKKVLLQGLRYAQKSQLDAVRRIERADEEKTGVAKPDLHGPRLIARAVRTPDGKRAFIRDEDELMYAISICEQLSDGELNRGADHVLSLSGWGKDAEADAGKS